MSWNRDSVTFSFDLEDGQWLIHFLLPWLPLIQLQQQYKKKLTLADHLEESIESRPVQQFIFVRMEPNPEMTTAGEYRSFKGAPAKIPK